MKRILNMNTAIILVSTTIGFLLGVLGNIFFEWAKSILGLLTLTILLVSLSLGLAILLAWLLSKKHSHVILRQAIKLRVPDERKRNAKRGLVSFVSLSKPKITGTALAQAIETGDFQAVYDFDNPSFNWQPLIHGIVAHQSKLEKLWLIGTESTDSTNPASGSAYFLPLLQKYLTEKHQISPDVFVEVLLQLNVVNWPTFEPKRV
jgi:hypothetical protein